MFAKELADLLVIKRVEGSLENIVVDKLAQDSRKVVPNTMFFCIEGVTVDGHLFAGKAKELGANVFVASKYDWSYRNKWKNDCNPYGGLFIRRIRKTNSIDWNDVS